MNRLVPLAAIASITLVTVTPTFAQGRFGNEAAESRARRMESEAIRRAEHPELYEKAAEKPAKAPAQVAAGPPQTEERSAVAQPAPVPEPAVAPAQ